MVSIVVVTRAALLIARRGSRWAVDAHLRGRGPDCVAVDPCDQARVYCGTAGAGLFRSRDSGRTWEPVGRGIDHLTITAVAVGRGERPDRFGIVYTGTEPTAVFRSETAGDDWMDLAGLRALPSASTWSFPPRPHTHHVRWVEPDVSAVDRVFVAIEAGALVRTFDGGQTWRDRVRGGPYDTHKAATHPLAQAGSTRPLATGTLKASMPGIRGGRPRTGCNTSTSWTLRWIRRIRMSWWCRRRRAPSSPTARSRRSLTSIGGMAPIDGSRR